MNALCSYNRNLTIVTYFMCRNRNYEKVPGAIRFLSCNLFIWLSGLSQQSHALLYFREFLQYLAHLGLIKLQTEKLRFLQNKRTRTTVEKDDSFSGVRQRGNGEFWFPDDLCPESSTRRPASGCQRGHRKAELCLPFLSMWASVWFSP